VRDYYFFIAFEEAGIWEELALASDGSLPRPGTEGDRLVSSYADAPRSKTFYVKDHPRHPQVVFGFPRSNDRKTVIDRFLLQSFSFRSFPSVRSTAGQATKFALVFSP
jgi:hypothetical protein